MEEKKNIKNIRRIRDRVYVVPFTSLKTRLKLIRGTKCTLGKSLRDKVRYLRDIVLKKVNYSTIVYIGKLSEILKDYKLCPEDINKIWENINKKNSH